MSHPRHKLGESVVCTAIGSDYYRLAGVVTDIEFCEWLGEFVFKVEFSDEGGDYLWEPVDNLSWTESALYEKSL